MFYRYEVYHNCNLTEIGEPFAEQPYALAVQQGSHLQEELSRAILELQKDRRGQCKLIFTAFDGGLVLLLAQS